MRMCVCESVRVCVKCAMCMYMYVYNIHIYIYIYMHVVALPRVCISSRFCGVIYDIHICVYVCVCVYIYTNTHTHSIYKSIVVYSIYKTQSMLLLILSRSTQTRLSLSVCASRRAGLSGDCDVLQSPCRPHVCMNGHIWSASLCVSA